MKKLIISFFTLIVALTVGVTADLAQATPVSNNPAAGTLALSEAEIGLLRCDLRSEKKKLIAMNVPMSDTEARFWPVYDQYVEEMTKVH